MTRQAGAVTSASADFFTSHRDGSAAPSRRATAGASRQHGSTAPPQGYVMQALRCARRCRLCLSPALPHVKSLPDRLWQGSDQESCPPAREVFACRRAKPWRAKRQPPARSLSASRANCGSGSAPAPRYREDRWCPAAAREVFAHKMRNMSKRFSSEVWRALQWRQKSSTVLRVSPVLKPAKLCP